MNEILRRALVDAGLDEVCVAADLGVDPKTVRRWLEGRVPRPRHRRALAALTGLDEPDIWKELRGRRRIPPEVTAMYSHRWAVPGSVWTSLLQSAVRAVDILDSVDSPPPDDEDYAAEIQACVRRNVPARILLCSEPKVALPDDRSGMLFGLAALGAQVRVYSAPNYHSMLRADDQMIVHHRVEGVAGERTPVVHLSQVVEGRMYASYLEGFEQIWRIAEPVVRPDVT